MRESFINKLKEQSGRSVLPVLENKEFKIITRNDFNEIEMTIRAWDEAKKTQEFTKEENTELIKYINNLVSSNGMKLERTNIGNIYMSADDYKFIKDRQLVYDFAIVQ